ncbi:amino acid permease [Peribacillus kribbensis]|uniref:amino acid permease n=1 Tax=Peribacillus kribbensis TaxID=356658 RepID=UPI0003FF62E9|nr:amino acid permease [Peribacillus kribbensis]
MKETRKHTYNKGLNAFSLAGLGIGGVIGAGFFLGSGIAVREAGPAVSLSFLIGGLIMMQVLGGMTSINVNRMQHGSFRVYAEEFLGSYTGFLLGWVVFASSILSIGSEALAMGLFVHLWLPHIPLAILATTFIVIIILINAMNMQFFSKVESGMAAVKALAILAFILLGVYAIYSKGVSLPSPAPLSSFHAFFPKGFSGVLQSMLVVIFSYSGISVIAMAATEVSKPEKQIPQAARYMTFGSIGLYALSMLVLVFITSWNTVPEKKSPFVQAFDVIGYDWAAVIMNFIVILAAFSVMAASYYSSLQMLVSLSEAKKGPHMFLPRTKGGFYRNAWLAVGISVLLVVGLSFLLSSKLYNYLISASSYITFLNWIVNLLTYLIWKRKRGEEETFQSRLIWGNTGAYATILIILVMFVMSLKVVDFRMGFYAAAVIIGVISLAYLLWLKFSRKQEKSHNA